MHTVLTLNGMATLARSVGVLTGRVAEWNKRARQRRDLARLDAWLLRDLGLSHDAVRRESSKLPWQL